MSLGPDDHLMLHEPDHRGKAADLLLWQHKGKPNLEALVRAFGAGTQLLEETIWAVVVGGGLDAAEGVTLDRWGELVGELRGALEHEDYRKFIGLRIRVNTEHPSFGAMAAVLASAVDPSELESYLVADGIVYVVQSGPTFLDDSIASHAGALIRDFRPAGIYAAVTEQVEDGAFIGEEGDEGTLIGSIASPGPNIIGRLIYSGRSREPSRGV